MENNKAIIENLNDLVQINNDRIVGYENALKQIEEEEIKEEAVHTDLRNLFLGFIDDSRRFKMQLAKEVQVLGADAETDTSTSGKLHRAWMDIKTTFTGHSEKSILEECEFGEDAIKKAYESALEDEDVPVYIRDILNAQLSILVDAHDEIKLLRDSA
ncbi:MAG: PA2169 family four-helix-bundle protein [Mucilaginibacter sp.]